MRVDTTMGKVLEWRRNMLHMEQDSVKIHYNPPEAVTHDFFPVRMLLKFKDSKFYLRDTVFKITVKDNISTN